MKSCIQVGGNVYTDGGFVLQSSIVMCDVVSILSNMHFTSWLY